MKTTTTGRLAPQLRDELERLIERHNKRAYNRCGKAVRNCSYRSEVARRATILLAFGELAQLGYRLRDPRNLADKHVRALARHWNEKGLSSQTIHGRFSVLRVFSGWIGKRGLVGDLPGYFPGKDMRRQIAATRNHGWEANGVSPEELVRRARGIDERLALYLNLQHVFGLRAKEAIMLRPLRAITPDGGHLEVSDGTKGGRPRLVPIDSDERRAAIAWAREVASRTRSHCLRWPGLTWEQAQARFYRGLAKLGVTRRQLGVTSHGLRHGYAQQAYRVLTGQPSPVEGGALGRIDRERHRLAGMKVSALLGHGRVDVTGYYYGSYGHALRLSPEIHLARQKEAPLRESG
ncbi:MAG: integrase domain-containing protein [Rhodocyclaceae bacterium]|nr:integrase domain-containing protein [Rhodocyclaceae bacterium]